MTRNSTDPQSLVDSHRTRTDGVLPLAVRQRLWDQVWVRLLAPPVDAGDKGPAPKHRDPRDGGQR
jgi:hypothetical protein